MLIVQLGGELETPASGDHFSRSCELWELEYNDLIYCMLKEFRLGE